MRLSRLLMVILLSGLRLWAAEKTQEDDPSVAELAAVRADLARFERLLGGFQDERNKPRIVEALESLKKRAEALTANFDQQKCDDLRFDINQQAQRLARYRQPLITPPKRETGLQLSALNPDPGNRDEVAAALAALDREISRQVARITADSPERARQEERLNRIRKERGELSRQFTRERWDAITRALKSP
jgi:septal ring factor EnvC (AmiA/AmiB activator)